MYNKALKDNPYIKFAVLTGCLNIICLANPVSLGARVLYRYTQTKKRQAQEAEMMKRTIIAKQQAIIKKMEEENLQNEEQRKNLQETIEFLEEALKRIEEGKKDK